MNSIQNKNQCFTPALQSRRSLNELTPYKDRYLPSLENSPARAPTLKKSTIGQYKPDTNSKWYQQPKIPVQLNSSTLIRRKTNTNSSLDNVVRKESNNQLALNALTFLKREQRASDLVNEKYEIVPKGMLPFDKSSYIKGVLSKIVSSGDNASLQGEKSGQRPSANPSGDGVDQSGIYHRVSALSINDLKSGCNVKYFEEVSFQAKTSSSSLKKHDIETEVVKKLENVRATMTQCTREWTMKPAESEFMSKFTASRQITSNQNDTSDYIDDNNNDDDGKEVKSKNEVVIKKKNKKNKKPVVVTCLKNSTVKYVKRK
ncbi:uncharacterized protein LOC135840461 [Planococcus citri]|uniref:uncharacterized protein LOC135840461 n=1 Tax=Planococcus citri TaxID=170843 RepID=UPI0031F76C1A